MLDFLKSAQDRRRDLRKDILLAVGLTTGILLVVIVPMAWSAYSTKTTAADASAAPEVKYEIQGTAKTAAVTYSTPSGTVQNTADLPMMNQSGSAGIRFTAEPGQSLYVSAQNQGEHGTVECVISVDGVIVSDNTSSGAYTIAQCSATAP